MHNFTLSFAAGLAALALALAAPAARAQSAGLMASDLSSASSEVASISPTKASTDEPVRRLSAPADEATASAYYNDSHKDLTQALAWMQETNALHPEYWSMYAEARIRLQLKDYAGAQAKATEARKLAVAAANADYTRRSDELLTQAKAYAK